MELIESLGHLCVFLPKYHPELNFIERFWSRLKWWLRQHCEWSLRALFEKIEEACDNIELSLIRKYARTAWRWMDAYRQATRQEWSPQLTTFVAKSYHGHRGVPTSMDTLIDELASWNKAKAVARAQELVEQDTEMRRVSDSTSPPDMSGVDPVKLKGLYINKEFDGFGMCKGLIKSVDKELGTGRTIFAVEYLDGDNEDLFLNELLPFLRVDEVYTHVGMTVT